MWEFTIKFFEFFIKFENIYNKLLERNSDVGTLHSHLFNQNLS